MCPSSRLFTYGCQTPSSDIFRLLGNFFNVLNLGSSSVCPTKAGFVQTRTCLETRPRQLICINSGCSWQSLEGTPRMFSMFLAQIRIVLVAAKNKKNSSACFKISRISWPPITYFFFPGPIGEKSGTSWGQVFIVWDNSA